MTTRSFVVYLKTTNDWLQVTNFNPHGRTAELGRATKFSNRLDAEHAVGEIPSIVIEENITNKKV